MWWVNDLEGGYGDKDVIPQPSRLNVIPIIKALKDPILKNTSSILSVFILDIFFNTHSFVKKLKVTIEKREEVKHK